jgi:hypothetical protein
MRGAGMAGLDVVHELSAAEHAQVSMLARVRGTATKTGHVLLWYVLPAILVGLALSYWVRGAGTDFDANVWRPALAVVHGNSPYPSPELAALVGHATFLYPPPILLFDLPFAALPHSVARTAFWAITIGSVIVSLWIVGVRDRRVLLVASLAYPVWLADVLGNPTLLLLVPVALAWRYRDQPGRAGLAVGCAIAFKLIVWPLGLWLLATRRFRATAVTAGTSLVLVTSAWAAIGFKGLADYPHLLRLFSEKTGAPRAFTVTTLGTKVGLDASVGRVLQVLCGLALLAGVWVLAHREEGDRRAFSIAVLAALVISPVVEIWYVALLAVPLAILQPSYSKLWGCVWLSWLFVLAPGGSRQVVADDGQLLRALGRVPSTAQLLVVAAFIACAAVVVTRTPSKAGAP